MQPVKIVTTGNQTGNNSDKINAGIIAIVDKLLEYKCISRKQQTNFN